MTIHRILDILCYAMVDYIAYIPLVFFPFRKKMRYATWLSMLSMVGIAGAFIVMTAALVDGLPTWLVPIISVTLSIVTMTWGLDVHPGKCMMVLLMEYSNASFIVVVAKNLEVHFFPNRQHLMYCWTHSVFILIGVIGLFIFDYFITWKMLDQIINMPRESSAWNYIWITPLSFYLVWFIYVYTSNSYLNAVPEDPFVLIMLAFFEGGSVVTYFILLQLISFESENARLEYQEELNQSQYQHLSRRIDEARKSRHDIRHHFLIIDALAKEGNIQGIKEYLVQFSASHVHDDVLVYCKHFATNALFSYYSQQAKDEGFEFFVQCNLPSEVAFPDKDLTVIFGNLLENAMNACRKVKDQKAGISVNCKYDGASLAFIIKNTSSETPKKDKNGVFLSTSHSGRGIGIESVKTIVEKYHGIMQIQYENAIFSVSIMIPVGNLAK